MRMQAEDRTTLDTRAVRVSRTHIPVTNTQDTEAQLFTALEQAIDVVRELRSENIALRTRTADLEAQLRSHEDRIASNS